MFAKTKKKQQSIHRGQTQNIATKKQENVPKTVASANDKEVGV
jgi:hypothetical protein